MTLSRELTFFAYQWRQNLKNQQALRTSFVLQIVAMFLNNIAFFVIWIMFSRAVGMINGWGVMQTFGMMCVSMLTYGIVHALFGSTGSLSDTVPNGQFDAYLAKPKNLYTRIINRQMEPTALGDLLQGILGMMIFFCMTHASIGTILLFLVMVPPGAIAQVSFIMVMDCIIFWLPQTPVIGNTLRDLIILPTTQPISLIRGTLRVIYLTAIPALLVAGLPIEIITYHTYSLLALAYTVSLIWLAISIWVLNISVRRYESGNVIG